MRLIYPSYQIITPIDRVVVLKLIELCGRTCYKSEDKITEESASSFVKKIVDSGHHSVLEHYSITVNFVVNRGFTHELVRSRIASYSQESTRYCNYDKDKFGSQITFIIPHWTVNVYQLEEYSFLSKYNSHSSDATSYIYNKKEELWLHTLDTCEKNYLSLIKLGMNPQDARGVLPIDLKTEIKVTCNLREWMHIFTIRAANPKAHPCMHQIMIPLLKDMCDFLPEVFSDIFKNISKENKQKWLKNENQIKK